jgi:hypothetical protein
VNEDGLIESVATGVPRVDFTGGGCGKLLLEPQRTNLTTYSQTFTLNALTGWVESFGSVTLNVATSPDGTTNAASYKDNNTGGTGEVRIYNEIIVDAASSYTFSIFVKSSGLSQWAYLQATGYDGGTTGFAYFDIVNGVVGINTNLSSTKIENYGNGWYRCSITWTQGAADTVVRSQFQVVAGNGVKNVTRNGTNGYYVWGAQTEKSSFSTSYIPTTTTAVTRVADAANRTSASSFVGLSSGTIYLELYQDIKSGDLDILSINNSSGNYLFRCRLNGSSLSFVYNGGSSATTFAANVNLVNNSRNKIAIKYNAATKVSQTYFNGVFQSTTTGANAYSVLAQNNIFIGPWFATSYMQLQGLMLFTTELSDSDLIALTTL